MLLTPGVPLSEEDLRWVTEHEGEVTSHGLDLSFHMYSTHAVLRAILPLCIGDVPGAYETVGHIAHLNLRKEQLPFKCIIGGLCFVHMLMYTLTEFVVCKFLNAVCVMF